MDEDVDAYLADLEAQELAAAMGDNMDDELALLREMEDQDRTQNKYILYIIIGIS